MPQRHTLAFAILGALVLLASPIAAHGQNGIVWDDPVAVDTGVVSLPSSSGVAAQWLNDRLWIFYEKSNDIWAVARGPAGWGSPRRLTTDPARQCDPHVLGYTVIWEDRRGTVPEIWKARFDGTTWSDESILSPNDGIPSRHGVISGGYPGLMLAAWEDSLPTRFRVQVRRHDGTSWLTPEPVTLDISGQRDPSVGGAWELVVAWADSRNGEPEIYKRIFVNGSWGQETRVTDLPGACRHPSLILEMYGDVYDAQLLAFESTEPSGVIETYTRTYWGTQRISPDDGVPSVSPNSAAFALDTAPCGLMNGSDARHYVTWTDLGTTRSHQTWGPAGIDPSPVPGTATSIVAAMEGSPQATVAQAWIESRSGVPTLMARLGHTAGCLWVQISAPPSILLAPAGTPATVVRALNYCGGDPLSGTWLTGSLDYSMVDRLTWDPANPPSGVLDGETNDAGELLLPLYGGGCSQSGLSYIECSLHERHEFLGAKSPDVNGDCLVGEDDRQYVESRIGTADFCADLDMSGTVDLADLAIVEAALWSHCSTAADVRETDAAEAPALLARPNPARDSVQLHRLGGIANAGEIAIYDAAGRLVRTLSVPAGAPFASWDLRGSGGDRVAGGVYFAVSWIDGRRVSRAVLAIR